MTDPDKESARLGFTIAVIGIGVIFICLTVGSLYEYLVK